MKSFFLQQVARLLIPLALLLGVALLLQGHNQPGGGFVGGLLLATSGILAIAAYGPRAFRANFPLLPEKVAVSGIFFLFATLLAPMFLGDPALTHHHGELRLLGTSFHWHAALFFDIGVMLGVGGGMTAAAIWLWEEHPSATTAAQPESGHSGTEEEEG